MNYKVGSKWVVQPHREHALAHNAVAMSYCQLANLHPYLGLFTVGPAFLLFLQLLCDLLLPPAVVNVTHTLARSLLERNRTLDVLFPDWWTTKRGTHGVLSLLFYYVVNLYHLHTKKTMSSRLGLQFNTYSYVDFTYLSLGYFLCVEL